MKSLNKKLNESYINEASTGKYDELAKYSDSKAETKFLDQAIKELKLKKDKLGMADLTKIGYWLLNNVGSDAMYLIDGVVDITGSELDDEDLLEAKEEEIDEEKNGDEYKPGKVNEEEVNEAKPSAEKTELLELDKKLFSGGKAIDAGTDWEDYLDKEFPSLKNLGAIPEGEDVKKALAAGKKIAKKHNIKESFVSEASIKNGGKLKSAEKKLANQIEEIFKKYSSNSKVSIDAEIFNENTKYINFHFDKTNMQYGASAATLDLQKNEITVYYTGATGPVIDEIKKSLKSLNLKIFTKQN